MDDKHFIQASSTHLSPGSLASDTLKKLDSEEKNVYPDAQVQNIKATRIYIFGDADVTEDEINSEEITELRSRSAIRGERTSNRKNDETEYVLTERSIEPGDTLQKVALTYGCPVSELKRVNNFINEQDFFALKVIKVPMKRHGMLMELIARENEEGNTIYMSDVTREEGILHIAEPNEQVTDNEFDCSDSEQQNLLVRKIGIRGPIGNTKFNHCDFLEQMDKDINKIVSSTRTRLDSLEKVVEKMTCKSILPLERRKSQLWSGADCGIRWWSIVAAMFLVGFVTPLVYLLYYEYVKPS